MLKTRVITSVAAVVAVGIVLFVLPPFAVVLWALLRRTWEPVRSAPKHWFFAILLALVTHPLPAWFQHDKIGLSAHWGPYAAPGWTPRKDQARALSELRRD